MKTFVARTLSIAGLLSLLALGACSKNQMPQGEEVPVASSSNELNSASAGSGTLSLTAPAGWISEQPSSSMRQSQYRLPGQDGAADAEVAVFTGIGGSAQANVERWVHQFTKSDGSPIGDSAQIKTEQVGNYKVTMVDVSGTYTAAMGPMMGGGSAETHPDYRMLAAVIETGQGAWFVKMTGPAPTVAHWKDSFDQFIESAK
ncbi:MAG: hypothetical protein WAL98_18690 [Desulfatiglandaceae bacterium]